ncbi:MAG: ribosome assembly factor SBDS [Candidatus Pacearchaeota archaeon]|jgi:ribosome maturation protein SDO1
MTDVIARIKTNGKNFEILVDLDKALEFKRSGQGDIQGVLETDFIFTDSKKGLKPTQKDLMDAFKTEDINEIAAKIVKNGEVQVPAEYKEKQREGKFKQIVDFLVRNAVDPRTNRPYTPERIERSLDEAGANITNKPVEAQIPEIVDKLRLIIPIKIETKKILVTIPVAYTGQIYGLLQIYKESEEWMSNGDLKCRLNIPVGFQMEFYDKLNSMTHGSAIAEEIKEK